MPKRIHMKRQPNISFYPASKGDSNSSLISIDYMPKEYHDILLETFCHICDKMNSESGIYIEGDSYLRKPNKFETIPKEKIDLNA